MLSFLHRKRRLIFGATAVGVAGYVGYKLWQRQQEIMLIYREVAKALRASDNRCVRVASRARHSVARAIAALAQLARLQTARTRARHTQAESALRRDPAQ